MSEDLILKCLIAFILGWLASRMMGNRQVLSPTKSLDSKHTRSGCGNRIAVDSCEKKGNTLKNTMSESSTASDWEDECDNYYVTHWWPYEDDEICGGAGFYPGCAVSFPKKFC